MDVFSIPIFSDLYSASFLSIMECKKHQNPGFFPKPQTDTFYNDTVLPFRVMYNHPFVSMIGIFLCFDLDVESTYQSIHRKKIKLLLNSTHNLQVIKKCAEIEADILTACADKFQGAVANSLVLQNFFKEDEIVINPFSSTLRPPSHFGNVKLTKSAEPTKQSLILKINGVWQNENKIGLSYKLFEAESWGKKMSGAGAATKEPNSPQGF